MATKRPWNFWVQKMAWNLGKLLVLTPKIQFKLFLIWIFEGYVSAKLERWRNQSEMIFENLVEISQWEISGRNFWQKFLSSKLRWENYLVGQVSIGSIWGKALLLVDDRCKSVSNFWTSGVRTGGVFLKYFFRM